MSGVLLLSEQGFQRTDAHLSHQRIRHSSNEMDEAGAHYTEWSKPERKTPILYTNAYIWNLERW